MNMAKCKQRMSTQNHDSYLAFRSPGFGLFFVGALLNHMGAAIQSVGIAEEVYLRSGGSAMALGMVGLMQAIPMLIFTLPAGYLADVYDRRKVLAAGLVGSTLVSLMLGVFSVRHGSIPIMYALLFLDAAFHRLTTPASQAIIPLLVPRDSLENAIKWRSSMFQISLSVGPAAGGMIIACNLASAYWVSAAMTLAMLLILWRMQVPSGVQSVPGRMLAQLKEGINYVWSQKIILGALSLDLFAVLLGGAVYLLPIFVHEIIHDRPFGMSPEQMLGWLRAAPFFGATVMALILAHRPPLQNAGRSMFAAVAAFGVATLVFGLSRNFWLSFLMLFLTGFFDNISVVIRQTLVQLRTPNELRGRVSAVNSVFIGSSNELGGFESGLVARFVGAVNSVLIGGVGTLLVVGGWMKLFPELRKFKRLA